MARHARRFRAGVLRIEEINPATIRLEGKLLEPWVEAVRQAALRRDVSLDLSAVTFADDAGVRLLRELVDGGANVVSCSNFIAALLQLQPEIRS